jgi:regulator of sirC expression with transglutaminase-like and TPR domain
LTGRRAILILHPGGSFVSLKIVDEANEQPMERPPEALLRLLDDSSPAVRQSLVAYFARLGPVAERFLRELALGENWDLSNAANWYLRELKYNDPIADFRGFIRSLNYELETGSLLLARTVSTTVDIGACCAALDKMAQRCRELMAEPSSFREKCRIVNRVLFHEWGFRGNVEYYTDPQNSLLDHVLARRKGIPISLSIVYLLVAERLGLDVEPVGLPGHFMVGCFADRTPFFIDPFEQGLFRSHSEVIEFLRQRGQVPQAGDLAPSSVRDVLSRSCRNLSNHYRQAGDLERARLFATFIEDFDAAYAKYET